MVNKQPTMWVESSKKVSNKCNYSMYRMQKIDATVRNYKSSLPTQFLHTSVEAPGFLGCNLDSRYLLAFVETEKCAKT